MPHFKNTRHTLAFTAALALCVLGVYWEWRGAPLRLGGSWLVLKMVPLTLCLGGLWRGSLYTMQCVSMLILLYMAEGVVRGMGDVGVSAVYAWMYCVLSWVCFFACILYARPYKRAAKLALAPSAPTSM